ncbi:MAG: hypothetical protein MJ195_01300 [Mycoplasmoidaceae bacterium]|nr:hypothetical protein [Mycoplasmoidaceae bacterium]
MIKCDDGVTEGLLEPNTIAPSLNLLDEVRKALYNREDYGSFAPELTYAKVQKTAYIFNNVCYAKETILYTSMTT